mmetsp:Transcript_3785/g.8470  ORF Transcript_3785/g.8470 Transcript_3785/m.8470 type:complete len:228 (-) Transcript_3785:600-1283(-)
MVDRRAHHTRVKGAPPKHVIVVAAPFADKVKVCVGTRSTPGTTLGRRGRAKVLWIAVVASELRWGFLAQRCVFEQNGPGLRFGFTRTEFYGSANEIFRDASLVDKVVVAGDSLLLHGTGRSLAGRIKGTTVVVRFIVVVEDLVLAASTGYGTALDDPLALFAHYVCFANSVSFLCVDLFEPRASFSDNDAVFLPLLVSQTKCWVVQALLVCGFCRNKKSCGCTTCCS